jgi:hypothetical protein
MLLFNMYCTAMPLPFACTQPYPVVCFGGFCHVRSMLDIAPAAAAASAAPAPASDLQQLLGPAADQEVLLEQPTARVVAKAKALRHGQEVSRPPGAPYPPLCPLGRLSAASRQG